MKLTYQLHIRNEKFGNILDERFVDQTQMKLFLKSIHTCLELKEDFSFFDGELFLIHIPYLILKDSLILRSIENLEVTSIIETRAKNKN